MWKNLREFSFKFKGRNKKIIFFFFIKLLINLLGTLKCLVNLDIKRILTAAAQFLFPQDFSGFFFFFFKWNDLSNPLMTSKHLSPILMPHVRVQRANLLILASFNERHFLCPRERVRSLLSGDSRRKLIQPEKKKKDGKVKEVSTWIHLLSFLSFRVY